MKIRKYTAPNTQEAIAKVKYELGSEALIINTKKVRHKGLLGYFKKPMIEVMAAIDEQSQAKTKYTPAQNRASASKSQPAGAQNDVFAQFQSQIKTAGKNPDAGVTDRGWAFDMQEDAPAENAASPVWSEQKNVNRDRALDAYAVAAGADRADAGARETAGIEAPAPALASAPSFVPSDRRSVVITKSGRGAAYKIEPETARDASLEIKVENIEAMLSKVYREVSVASKLVEIDNEKLAPLSKVLRLFYGNLVRNEVAPEFSMDIIERVNDSLQNENNTYDAATVLYNEVASVLGEPETINIRRDNKPTVAIFVGPTGVGKTTTLAKIAADSALNQGLDVAMITADTYRIAAVQQLKTYAEILGIPVSVAYTPGEIKNRIAELSDKDLILIDTAGRSHRHRAQFDELQELVSEAEADEVFLVMSATTGISNNREIVDNYRFLDEFKLIFTKADETPVFGSMLNARMLTGKRLSYVTVGQSVPDDIEVASIEKITRNLIGSMAE